MNKTDNQKAWFLVLPMLVLVAFSAVIPLMTVVNYSVQDTFGNNVFFPAGLDWFRETLQSDRMWASLRSAADVFRHHSADPDSAWRLHRAQHAQKRLLGLVLPGGDVAAAADPLERGRHDLADLSAASISACSATRWKRSALTTTTRRTRSTPGSR
jgi:hypothetical protein